MTRDAAVPANPVPEVYVLWHPKCPMGETAARRIYDWLRPGFGLGPRVFYRCLPGPGTPSGLPLPLPGEQRDGSTAPPSDTPANLQIVVPLIDDHMIADARFRYWLESIGRPAHGIVRRILPVALDSTAFRAPSPIRELNFVRPKSTRALSELEDSEREALLRSLLKQLTEALCRLLLGATTPSPATDTQALKLKVFLSHAKADGTVPARRIRDYIYSQTQLAAFYDENDIPFGSTFARVLKREATSTVALIAVRSARYATRPWCRREISLFRTPSRVPSEADDAGVFWRLNPVLVVNALDAGVPTLGVPELGNSPEIRWSSDVPDQEEQIVTTLLRDAMLSEFHAAVGRAIPAGPNHIILNWLPDPTTLLRVDGVRDAPAERTVLYPGHLSALDLDILWELLPNVRLKSFEEAWS
ncbi:MAG: toll/interleukin-1 receptor domain-containing protein [Polyangiaceae bacterium]|nr:toll/interleukin-1 receptor domain-containing protein [Polyangiaceae bacterium]